jgi:hypothetical protein
MTSFNQIKMRLSTLRLPVLKAWACTGLTMNGALYPASKGGAWRRRMGQPRHEAGTCSGFDRNPCANLKIDAVLLKWVSKKSGFELGKSVQFVVRYYKI